MRRYLALALAAVLAAISVSALALGMGEIRLNSYLNQRLDAEIELVSAAADELESLEVRLADRAAFERYGLERGAFLNNLQFRVIRRPNGTAYVRVTSTDVVREPFLTLLIEADWSSGRLLREYTLLLDPPTFASRERAEPEARPQVPAVEPAAPRVEREEPVSEPLREPVAEQPRVEEEVTGDVISIPPLEADIQDAPPVRAEATYPRQTAETYGPIQRNENLWTIANRLRPDESISINQMMIALYRANPEAFQGNINRLKAGYILRIPEFGDVTGITRSEAFNEAKRHNEEWQAGTRSTSQPAPEASEPAVAVEPELSLVAPEEDTVSGAEADVGIGGDASGQEMGADEPAELTTDGEVDGGAVDLGVESGTEERLLDIEDESLQALQEQDDVAATELDAPVLPDESVLEAPALETPTEETAVQDDAATSDVETEAEPEAVPPVVQPVRSAEPGFVEKLIATLTGPLGLGIGAALLVILLAGFLVVRKRREAARASAAAAMADWDESDDGDLTMLAGRDEEGDDVNTADDGDISNMFAHGMEQDDAGTTHIEDDTAATQMLADADKPESDEFARTMVGGQQAVTLDDNDPLSEADFHMAYGLYDQAAEVVQKAVQRDPSRKEFHAKLAEIHFAANNTNGFLEAARGLKGVAGPGDADWENIAIMGRQIAPDSDLFGESRSTSSVDLDFGSADEEFSGEETVVKPESSLPEDDALDFDLDVGGDDAASKPVAASDEALATDDSAMDFDLDIDDLGEAEGKADDTQEVAADDSGSDFDFDLGDLGETADVPAVTEDDIAAPSSSGSDDDETQTEFDKALRELSAFVDTNLPEQDAGDTVENDTDLNLDEYNFDDTSDSNDDASFDSGTGEDEDDIGEAGTKLDLARAYIDMGDPDGARGILEEVVSDGDDEQQKEARALLEQLA